MVDKEVRRECEIKKQELVRIKIRIKPHKGRNEERWPGDNNSHDGIALERLW